jgi:hypothetical protein
MLALTVVFFLEFQDLVEVKGQENLFLQQPGVLVGLLVLPGFEVVVVVVVPV